MAAANVGIPLKAVVSGATGATGQCLVPELLKSDAFREVIVIGRRPLKIDAVFDVDQTAAEESGRLKQHVVSSFDEFTEEEGKKVFGGSDVYFCCLGTTRAKAGSAENFRKIDYHLVVKLAQIAKAADVRHMSIVSSQMAAASSMFLYLRTKGEADDEVVKLGFTRTSIYRPGALVRYSGSGVSRFFSRVVLGLPTETLAKAMLLDAIQQVASGEEDEKQAPLYINNARIYELVRASGAPASRTPSTTGSGTAAAAAGGAEGAADDDSKESKGQDEPAKEESSAPAAEGDAAGESSDAAATEAQPAAAAEDANAEKTEEPATTAPETSEQPTEAEPVAAADNAESAAPSEPAPAEEEPAAESPAAATEDAGEGNTEEAAPADAEKPKSETEEEASAAASEPAEAADN